MEKQHIKRPLLAVGLVLAVMTAVRLKMGETGNSPGQPEIVEAVSGETVVMTGQVSQKDEDSFTLKSVILFQTNQEAVISQQRIPYQKKIICETDEAESVKLGSTVTVRGTFALFPHASNPGEFDSAVYYRSIQTCGQLKKTEILSQKQPALCFRERLYRLRCFWKKRLYGMFPEKDAAVMSALLLGDRSDLDKELKDLYQRNGILHILSISSLHITILGMGLYRLLRRAGLPVWAAALAGGLLMIVYGGMTGFGISACRAIAMYLLRMLAEITGRTYDMLNALGTVGAGMLLYNPDYLENSGFLLSFSSIFGIGILYPVLIRVYSGNGKPVLYGERRVRTIARLWKRKIKEGALLSFSIMLATLPVQLWFYYEVPVCAVLVNLLVLPFVKPLLLSGFAALLLPFGSLPGSLGSLILNWYEMLCGFFDRLPFSLWNPGRPEIWQIAVYYGLLGGLVRWYGKKAAVEDKGKAGRKVGRKVGRMDGRIGNSKAGRMVRLFGERIYRLRKGMTVSGILCFCILTMRVKPPAKNQLLFLNVGQGDCCIVRTASGQTYLFDCGSSSRNRVGKYVLLPCLKYYGIRTIDGVFLSHTDIDHVNGALELFELAEKNEIDIRQLVLPEVRQAEREEALGELIKAAEGIYDEREVPVRYLAAGDSWRCGNASFLCLHPSSGCDTENANEYSLCIYAVFGEDEKPELTVLFTGDVEGEGEEKMLEVLFDYGIRKVTLLKAAHHGSRNSTSEELLEQICPDIAVISCGENNSYGHPHQETLERLENAGCCVLMTKDSGAIDVKIDGNYSQITGYLGVK